MSSSEALFFHRRDPNFHHLPEVEHTADYLRQIQHIPNDPTAKIESYLGALASPELVNDGILTADQRSLDRQIEHAIVGPDDISESYFDLQLRIMQEEMGFDEFLMTAEVREGLVEMVREDQRTCLEEWAAYLTSDDAGYPDWFKFYAFSSLIKLTEYDSAQERFRRRSNGTAANFPELNQEALAMTFDAINASHGIDPTRQTDTGDELLGQLAQTANFAKVYSRAFNMARPSREERFETTEGRWVKYPETDDPEVISTLTKSLIGHGTTWCTANTATASAQLARGDFYVYYSLDKEKKYTIPRVAIRMEDERVAEVRGVEPGQNLEECMVDIATEQLAGLPGGDFYQKVAEDMRRVKAIYESFEAGRPLDVHDVFFLRGYGGKIHRFGYRPDRRVDRLLMGRDKEADFDFVLNTYGPKTFSRMLLEAGQAKTLLQNLPLFEAGAIDYALLADTLMKEGEFDLLLSNFELFEPGLVNTKELADAILDHDRTRGELWTYAGSAHLIGKYFQCFEPTDFDLNKVGPMLMRANLFTYITKNFDVLGAYVDKFALALGLARSADPLAVQKIDSFGLTEGQALSVILEIASKKKTGHYIARHFKRITTVIDEATLTKALLDAGYDEIVARIANKVSSGVIDQEDLFTTLLEAGKLNEIADTLQNFDDGVVDHADLFRRLVEAEKYPAITRNLRKFKPGVVDGAAYYRELIAHGHARLLCSHLDQFDPQSIDMRTLIYDVAAAGDGQALFRDLNSVLQHYTQKEVAKLLMDTGNAMVLNVNRYRFEQGAIDFDALATALIVEDRADIVLKNFELYESPVVTISYIAKTIKKVGNPAALSSHFQVFAKHMDHVELVAMLTAGDDPKLLKVIITNLEKFDEGAVDADSLAAALIGHGEIGLISRNISKMLNHVNHDRLARLLCAGNGADVVFRHRDKFVLSADAEAELATYRQDSVMGLIEVNAGRAAVRRLAEHPPTDEIDYTPVIEGLIARGQADLIVTDFPELPSDVELQKRILEALYERQSVEFILKHRTKFAPEAIDFNTLAKKMCLESDHELIEKSFNLFIRNMDPLDFAAELVTRGYAYLVEDKLSQLLRAVDHRELAAFLIDIGLDEVVERNREKFKTNDLASDVWA